VRLGTLLEALADAVAELTGGAAPAPLPGDKDPFDDAHLDAWRDALQPVWHALGRIRRRLHVRHAIAVSDPGDAALIERYLTLFWTPAVERAIARAGERALLSFEIVRAECTGVPLVGRSWRLGRREKRAAEKIVAAVENLALPDECRAHAFDELTSVSADDVVRWLRTERGEPRAHAEELAETVIAATRGGRFELVVQRVSAMTGTDRRPARRRPDRRKQ
jgi:hypothetical protein